MPVEFFRLAAGAGEIFRCPLGRTALFPRRGRPFGTHGVLEGTHTPTLPERGGSRSRGLAWESAQVSSHYSSHTVPLL